MKSRLFKKVIASGVLVGAISMGITASQASAVAARKIPVNEIHTYGSPGQCQYQYEYGTFLATGYAKARVVNTPKGVFCGISAQVITAKGKKIVKGSMSKGTVNGTWTQSQVPYATGFAAHFEVWQGRAGCQCGGGDEFDVSAF